MNNFPGKRQTISEQSTASKTDARPIASCNRTSSVVWLAFAFLLLGAATGILSAATCPRCFNESPRVVSTKTEAVSNPVRGLFTIQRTEYKCGKCGNKFRKVEALPPAPPAPPLPVVRSPNDSRLTTKTAVPPPPMPAGMKFTKASTERTEASFQPAAAADPNRTPMWGPLDFGGETMLVGATQGAGQVLQLHRTDTFPAAWQLIADYGYSANQQEVAIQIPAHWLAPDGQMRFFVRATNTPGVAPAAAMMAAPGVVTGSVFKVKGKSYRLLRVSPAGAEFTMYRLQPI